VLQNGSNIARDSPFYADAGRLVVLRINGFALARVATRRSGTGRRAPRSRVTAAPSGRQHGGAHVQQFRLEGNACARPAPRSASRRIGGDPHGRPAALIGPWSSIPIAAG